MELNMTDIGKRIKDRRKELNLSQLDIYERCDITSGALSKIENGKTTPSITAFYKLSSILECDMDWLATGYSSDLQNAHICQFDDELLIINQLSPDGKKDALKYINFLLFEEEKKRKETLSPSADAEDNARLA